MIKQAIILAGGLGKRLRPVISDIPKCMAAIGGKPFLHYLIEFYKKNGINQFVFSVGYLHEVIQEFLSKNYRDLKYNISIEKEPLGTGGAIQLACRQTSEQNVLVCNGDTFYKVDLHELDKLHQEKKAECTLCLKPMQDFDRYGIVELNPDKSIKSFKEKDFYKEGLINGGVYALNVEQFLKEDLPEKFSFEKDFLEKKVQLSNKSSLFGFIQDNYFIDIGIPEDYAKAQKELPEL